MGCPVQKAMHDTFTTGEFSQLMGGSNYMLKGKPGHPGSSTHCSY
jgi:hypothetical protein